MIWYFCKDHLPKAMEIVWVCKLDFTFTSLTYFKGFLNEKRDWQECGGKGVESGVIAWGRIEVHFAFEKLELQRYQLDSHINYLIKNVCRSVEHRFEIDGINLKSLFMFLLKHIDRVQEELREQIEDKK